MATAAAIRKIFTIVGLAIGLVLNPLYAEDTLTPVGAIKAENAAGTIPAWTGGLTNDNAPDFDPAVGFTDPFASDQPLFRITNSNYKTYANKLSAGHIQMLQTNPRYFLDVFPSRRSAAYPQAIYAAAIANEATAKLDGQTLTGATLSVPFRQPITGEEVITNHKFRYRGNSVTRFNNMFVVKPAGPNQLQQTLIKERWWFNFSNLKASYPSGDKAVVYYFVSKVLSPNIFAGEVQLVHELISPQPGWNRREQVVVNHLNWRIHQNTNHRRVRAPYIAYDYKPIGGYGLFFADQKDMFKGATDRYSWQLHGRQEFYIPYNSYKLAGKSLTYADILSSHHINQQLARYELHRVWVVEATLKAGAQHPITKRIFYVDEDSWGIAMVDLYDAKGDLWRFQEGHAVQFYGQGDVMFTITTPEIIYDFKADTYDLDSVKDAYFVTRLNNQEPFDQFENPNFNKSLFRSNYMKKIE